MNLELINPKNYIGNNDKYGVPRVTEILSAMLHEDYLMDWSNSLGLYQHKKYRETLEMFALIGTYTHEAIENYFRGDQFDPRNYYETIRMQVVNAFNSFLEWWSIIERQKDHKILMQEESLICKYFGGTLDMLIRINGKIYIVDFKTSNHSSYKHFLQLSAYRYMLEETKDIKVDGCIILMLDKKICKFTELVLDFEVPEHCQFIDNCEEAFLSLVYAFYNRGIVETQFKELFGKGKKNGSNKSNRTIQNQCRKAINQVL